VKIENSYSYFIYNYFFRLAQHITHVHRTNEQPELEVEIVKPEFFAKFIRKCSRYNPVVPESLSDYLVRKSIFNVTLFLQLIPH